MIIPILIAINPDMISGRSECLRINKSEFNELALRLLPQVIRFIVEPYSIFKRPI